MAAQLKTEDPAICKSDLTMWDMEATSGAQNAPQSLSLPTHSADTPRSEFVSIKKQENIATEQNRAVADDIPRQQTQRHNSNEEGGLHEDERNLKEYLDSLEVPDHKMATHIAEVQTQKEEEILTRLDAEAPPSQPSTSPLENKEREKAASVIQKNYRGHRERRMLNGMSLDPSSRWVEAVKEARYRQLTVPRARDDTLSPTNAGAIDALDGGSHERPAGQRRTSSAMQNWKKVGMITRRAGGDEESDSEDSEDTQNKNLTHEERETLRQKKAEKKKARQKAAKIMDLQYFLEMVDLKHRYGSNLRIYHEVWKAADTKENFFYWLDYGEGRNVESAACPRERLEREQVRYLSKEERLQYLVKIDGDGRLCWAKNGARIDTTQKYKDSVHGIVPAVDDTPAYAPPSGEAARHSHHHRRTKSNSTSSSSSSSSSDSEDSEAEDERADKYASPEFDNAKGVKKIRHVSAATIFNKLLRGSVKKNTWIFVADTSFRLYVGIKQSGSFQHSSFLHGSRISAAGVIKIKNGRLAKLSPLSGHYRPPGEFPFISLSSFVFALSGTHKLTLLTVSNFNAFVHSIKEEGVDMSHVSISRSYAVLVGLEAYVKTRRKGKSLLKKMMYHRDKLLSPEEVKEKEEAERDKSESAAKEKRVLEMEEKERKEEMGKGRALLEKLHLNRGGKEGKGERREVGETKSWERDPDVQKAGQGPENAIAPEGTRKD